MMTKNTPSTVHIQDGCKAPKSAENSPHGQVNKRMSAPFYDTECGKLNMIANKDEEPDIAGDEEETVGDK
nr:hypothetical protein [uncultured Dysosmobacter sp.]